MSLAVGVVHNCSPPLELQCNKEGPILDNKNPSAPSVFAPAALMREARRQKSIKEAVVPPFACWIRTATWSAIFAGPGAKPFSYSPRQSRQ